MRRQHFSWAIFVLCMLEALLWVHCTNGATAAAEVEEYLIRENENFKAPLGQDNVKDVTDAQSIPEEKTAVLSIFV